MDACIKKLSMLAYRVTKRHRKRQSGTRAQNGKVLKTKYKKIYSKSKCLPSVFVYKVQTLIKLRVCEVLVFCQVLCPVLDKIQSRNKVTLRIGLRNALRSRQLQTIIIIEDHAHILWRKQCSKKFLLKKLKLK